jgi:outer membrane receptor for ferrienterochelin and colicin
MKFAFRLFVWVFLLASSLSLPAQIDSAAVKAYYEQEPDSIDAIGMAPELKALTRPTGVATGTALNLRNTPNVITVVTREEIERSGARDLIDVLRLMPGVTFGLDEGGAVGLGLRGNWANEGKVLMMIDGQEVNDIYAANLSFGNHYPADLIERVELIRGPGSAIYGGFAEFGVINVITRGPEHYRGISLGYNFGQMARTRGRRQRMFYIGTQWGRNGKNAFSFSSFGGSGMRSDQDHFGFYDQPLVDSLGIGRVSSLAGNSRLNPRFTNLQLKLGEYSFRSLVDLYAYDDVRLLNAEGQRERLIKFRSNYSELKREWKINEKLTLVPRFNWVVQFPLLEGFSDSLVAGQEDARISRFRANVSAQYAYNHRTDLTGGVEWFRDKANNSDRYLVNPLYLKDGQVSYNNFAAYGQAVMRWPWINLILGGRLDANTRYGSAFSPRVAATHRFRNFHYKLMVSRAFRAPSIGNIARAFDGPNASYTLNADSSGVAEINGDIVAERTWVQEIELGMRLGEHFLFTANAFNISSTNPIVYTWYSDDNILEIFGDGSGLLVYQNAERSGTQGFELEARFRHPKGFVHANYSFYSVRNKERVPTYQVADFSFNPADRPEVDPSQLLAFPNHRFNLNACYYPADGISVNVSASYLGRRYGYDVVQGEDVFDENGNLLLPARFNVSGELFEEKPTLLTNVYVRYDRFWNGHLKLGLGVYDLLNQRMRFIQPYFGLNPPLPGPSREIIIKASWDLWRFGDDP